MRERCGRFPFAYPRIRSTRCFIPRRGISSWLAGRLTGIGATFATVLAQVRLLFGAFVRPGRPVAPPRSDVKSRFAAQRQRERDYAVVAVQAQGRTAWLQRQVTTQR
jgi:hypothetical protein